MIWGLQKGLIAPYDDKLIKKLRNIYYGGLPGSVILLSKSLSNGYCYDRALLMSRAFLDEEDDVKLIYANVNSIKLNPEEYVCDDPSYAEHCVVERITGDKRDLIYDTSSGFIYDKKIYWLIENPKITYIRDKNNIKKLIDEQEKCPVDLDKQKYEASIVLKMLELSYCKPNEMYASKGIELLQREIEYYKNQIDYKSVNVIFEEYVRKLKR